MCKPFDDVPFDIDHTEEIKHIEKIGKVASQINIDKDTYKKTIEAYFAFFAEKIKDYLGKDYFLITAYYSYLIPGQRITPPGSTEEVKDYQKKLKDWYDSKFDCGKAFSLVPIALKSHKLNQVPQKYCLILSNPKKCDLLDDIKKIDISSCYENNALWDKWDKIIRKGNDSDFEEVITKINENSNSLGIDECLNKIVKVTCEKNIEKEAIPPFILAWYPTHKEWPYQYYIPSPMLSNTPVGGIIVGTGKSINKKELLYLEDIALKVTVNINFLEHKEKVKRETVKHGTKSAILSIDVRNLSHNICSHVLAYWLQELKKLEDETGSSSDDLKKAINKSIALFRYIQHRADFLAEVATSTPCSEMSFDIKKDILNPFLGDTGDPGNTYTKKGTDSKITESEDGLSNDSNVYVLLRYIAESEGISINFDAENKTTKNIICEIDKSLFKENGNENEQPVYVSIPSGIIGKHAIYSILENFIRNAAKHYKGTDTTANGNFIKIKVSKPEDAWKDDYVAVEIIDVRKNSCDCEIVQKLNNFINGSFVKEDGSLESGGWGIKEMLISANFLRKNTPEYLYDVITGNKICNPPLLKIICKSNIKEEACDNKNCCKNCATNYNLAIRFYLKRPKHLAVMVDSVTEEIMINNVFEIKKITADEFKDKPIPYNILLVDESKYNTYKDDPHAPCRVMVYYNTNKELKRCMDIYNNENKNTLNNSMINDYYYLCLYEKFIKDEIWVNTKPLPKIVNDLDVEYKFKNYEEYALDTYKNGNGTNAKGNIVFKDHPEMDKTDTDFEDSEYFQPISGGFSTKAKFHKNYKFPEPIRKHFYLELIESALTKVVIVDERISEWADKPSKYNFGNGEYKTQREMLKKMKVYVAKIEKENISNLKEKLKEGVLGCSVLEDDNASKNTAHFFVIHQGILDKLEDKNFMGKIKYSSWKVIDSGRGVPEEMEYRFVQISALQTLLENYDKHGLVQTLFSLRKPVKEEQSGN